MKSSLTPIASSFNSVIFFTMLKEHTVGACELFCVNFMCMNLYVFMQDSIFPFRCKWGGLNQWCHCVLVRWGCGHL